MSGRPIARSVGPMSHIAHRSLLSAASALVVLAGTPVAVAGTNVTLRGTGFIARGAATPTASAARRRPTRAESAAIRSAALRSLHGSGWRVSAIRVSTVRAKHGYASAAVDNSATGVGGEMILRRDGKRWRRVFLGTDGFCEADAPKRVLRDLGFGCSTASMPSRDLR